MYKKREDIGAYFMLALTFSIGACGTLFLISGSHTSQPHIYQLLSTISTIFVWCMFIGVAILFGLKKYRQKTTGGTQ